MLTFLLNYKSGRGQREVNAVHTHIYVVLCHPGRMHWKEVCDLGPDAAPPWDGQGGGDGEPDALICLQDPDFVIWDFRMKELRPSEVVLP